MRTHALWMILAVAALAAACQENPVLDSNNPPLAVAWVEGHDIPRIKCTDADYDESCPVDETARRMGVELPYAGSDVTVTLDATFSADRDGEIAGYRWLSANFGPDCKGRDPDEAHDPKDEAKPELTLGEGFWEFGLWVEDDDGELSNQSVVTVTIGGGTDPCPNGPGGSESGGTGEDAGISESEQCILDCTAEMCPTEAAACEANPDCWLLNRCVAQNCADIDPADTLGQIACAQGMCGDFIGGATDSIAISSCAMACQAECAGM